MADEPSIDEILASLERLLNEGEGRNDEPAGISDQATSDGPSRQATEESIKKPTKKPEKEPAEKPVEAPGPGFFTALDHAVSEPYNEAGGSEPEAVRGAGRADEVPARKEAAAKASHGAAAQTGMKRIVLTDAMLVKDVQQSLPLDMGEAPRAVPEAVGQASGASGKVSASDSAGWSERDIQALVDQVTDDVCSAMSEQLPEMIRKALAHRLSAFIDVRMRHQDSGPEE